VEQNETAEEIDEDSVNPDTERISPNELHQLISELPDGYRMVLNLYVFENYSHRQIAELLGIKESTSASQLYYAKQWLARRIKELTSEKG
jgi:RNA polymerase sigma-70 factor (ECF subfamily)